MQYEEKQNFEYKNVTKIFVSNIIKSYILDNNILIICDRTLHSSTLGKDCHSFNITKKKNNLLLKNIDLDRVFHITLLENKYLNPIIIKNF
jgi:hypothetical protein